MKPSESGPMKPSGPKYPDDEDGWKWPSWPIPRDPDTSGDDPL